MTNPDTSVRYFLSPQTLRIEACRCLNPRDPPQTAPATIDYMLRRLDKLWSRMRGWRLDPKVRLAAERLLIQLRRQGMELFHLVGVNKGTHAQGSKTRGGMAILLLFPDWGEVYADPVEEDAEAQRRKAFFESNPDGEDRTVIACGYGHRIVAEINVLLHKEIRSDGIVDRIDTRLAHDWSDTISVADYEYYREEGAPPASQLLVTGGEDDEKMIRMVWQQVNVRMSNKWTRYEKDFGKSLKRVAVELLTDGFRTHAYEVERVIKALRMEVGVHLSE
ncbi:hypothetical protein BD324DRAFT_649234 [Kockovaella imperatae]|uniref:Uncharacterized protein n=1 Tax=Kockovaella imperatae TaxID=4999 RepID=A0A1Y1UPS6_9TREE|nr:hypothetical protein BD324DRAFT_649234 [Kockovaella imperatae]ORX39145.1 hypothetical protein BD324DRAFT_649234 [Kockovaella imperatae]